MTNFPTSLDTLTTGIGASGDSLASPNHITQHTNESQAIEALEAKVGVNSSAVTTSLDYKVKNTSSIDPGHKHTAASLTMALDDISDVTITAVADGNGLTYSTSAGAWVNSTTSVADASSTVKGVTKLSVAAASATIPIAVGDNDTRVPTQGENDALVGDDTSIAIGTGNKFISQTGYQKGTEIYAADSVGTDAYAITLSPVPTAYATGQRFYFKAGTANTNACTLNVNTLGAITLKKNVSTDLATGDILVNQIVEVVYDGTNFQVQSLLAGVQPNNIYAQGIITRAGDAAGAAVTTAHGLSRTPTKLKFSATKSASATSTAVSIGAFTGSTNSCVYSVITAGGGSDAGSDVSNAIRIEDTSSAYQTAVASVDATNITLTWTKTSTPGNPNINIMWEAFA